MTHSIDNGVVFNRAEIGFSEAYYVLWNDPEQKLSMIVRYVLFNGPSDAEKIAEVWGWFRDRSATGVADLAIRQRYNLDQAKFETGDYAIEIGNSGLTSDRCWGEISNGKETLRWDFDLNTLDATGINRLPGTERDALLPKFYSPGCKMLISGTVQVDEDVFEIRDVNASDGHYWNTHNMHTWNWCNGVTFQNDPSFIFEGIAAKFNDWGQPATWLHFVWDGQHYSSDLTHAFFKNREIESDLSSWTFSSEHADVKFDGTVTARPSDMIVIVHPLPDGNNLYTHISYNADLRITISKRDGEGAWSEVRTVEALDTASFEVTKPVRNPMVEREFEVVTA